MKKLIELDAALDALREVIVPQKDIGFGDELTEGYNDGIDMAITVLNGLPTVDAVPVVHGRWIRVYSRPGVFKYLGWTCDQCGQRTVHEYAPQWYKFCPNCGAKMDGKDGDGNG